MKKANDRTVVKRGAFTLVELLVVVAIIALLVAILLPALGRVRAAAATRQCGINLRSMGQATHMYVRNNRDWIQMWGPADSKEEGKTASSASRIAQYLTGVEAWTCPTRDRSTPYVTTNGAGGYLPLTSAPTVFAAPYVAATGTVSASGPPNHYAVNLFIHGLPKGTNITGFLGVSGRGTITTPLDLRGTADPGMGMPNQPGSNSAWVPPYPNGPININAIRDPNARISMHDIKEDPAGLTNVFTITDEPADIYANTRSANTTNPPYGESGLGNIHEGGVNALFIDTHVEILVQEWMKQTSSTAGTSLGDLRRKWHGGGLGG